MIKFCQILVSKLKFVNKYQTKNVILIFEEISVFSNILYASDETFQKFVYYLKDNNFSDQDIKDEIVTWSVGVSLTSNLKSWMLYFFFS